MYSRSRATVLALIVVSMTSGCLLPRTKVIKNPGPDDTGVRYYRPKPYLLVQPAADSGGAFVTITLQQLPDYEEEYSIHVATGLGSNHTNLTLTDGWNLTGIDQTLDSNFDENVTAIGSLLSSIGGLAKPTADGAPSMVVRASNVPIGYYESIISRDANGCKRLYGWRYVGFTPYEPCPVESNGVVCHTCHDQPLFALTFREGVMVFEPLAEVGMRRADECYLVPGSKPPESPNQDDAVKAAASKVFHDSLQLELPAEWLTLEWSENRTGVTITVTASEAELSPIATEYAAKKTQVDDGIKAVVGGLETVDMKFVPKQTGGEPIPAPPAAPIPE
jgi:hypothetical protein